MSDCNIRIAFLLMYFLTFQDGRKHVINLTDFGLTGEVYYGKNYYQHNQEAAQLPLWWISG